MTFLRENQTLPLSPFDIVSTTIATDGMKLNLLSRDEAEMNQVYALVI
jgi:hypothetical protein